MAMIFLLMLPDDKLSVFDKSNKLVQCLFFKVDSYSKNTEDDSQEHNDENGEKCGTPKMKTIEDIFKQKNNYSDFQLQIQSTNQVQGMKKLIINYLALENEPQTGKEER